MPTPTAILTDALADLRASIKHDVEAALIRFEQDTGCSISAIVIRLNELSASPHPLYAVKAVDVEVATE